MGYRRARRHPRRPAFANALIQFGDDLADLLCGRLWFILGGHFTGIDFLDNLGPDLSVRAGLEVPRQLIQPQITLRLLGTMTAHAVLGEKTLEGLGAVRERT